MAKIGMIGSGGISRHHCTRLAKIDAAEIVACADVSEESRAKLAEDFGIEQTFESYHGMLALDAVEAVYVCLPTFLHKDAVIAAAEAGKQIFCEKPMAMSLDDAQAMIDVCEAKGVKLMLGFVRRYDSSWGKLRELIQAGAIGRPVLWRHCSASGGPTRKWFNDAEKGGGPLIDGAVHNYDFARHIFGDAELAMGSMKNFKPDNTALDTGSGLVRFKSDDEVMVCWSWGLPDGCRGGNLIDVLGPEGAIEFSAAADAYPEGTSPQTHGGFTILGADGAKRVEVYEKNDMFQDQAQCFVDCVDNDVQPMVTGIDGKLSLEIGLAILESSRQGQSVAMRNA